MENITVKVKFDRERHIKFDRQSIEDFAAATGSNPLYGLIINDVKELAAFLFHGLKHEDPELTMEKVNSWLHPGGIYLGMKAYTAYVKAVMPPKEEGVDPLAVTEVA